MAPGGRRSWSVLGAREGKERMEMKKIEREEDSRLDGFDLLNVAEAAQALRLSIATIRKWIFEEKIPHVRLGRWVLFRRSDLQEFIEKNLKPARR